MLYIFQKSFVNLFFQKIVDSNIITVRQSSAKNNLIGRNSLKI